MDEAQQAAALLKFAKRGQPMKAFHAISSLRLAPLNDATRQTVHKLLGSTTPIDNVPPEHSGWQGIMHDHSFDSAPLAGLDKSLLKMKRNKAFDHHGWTAESARIFLSDARVWHYMEAWLTHLAATECNMRSLTSLHSWKCVPQGQQWGATNPHTHAMG
eukprot:4072654-Amphidinium_carterae.1